VVRAADPARSIISVFWTGAAILFQAAPHLSSEGLSGPRSRPIATQKIWQHRESNPGPLGLQPASLTNPPSANIRALITRVKTTEITRCNCCRRNWRRKIGGGGVVGGEGL
jgi:hypothetical protein